MIEIPQESSSGVRKIANWPSKGEVEFRELTLRYRKDTEIVLDNISFKINSNEKIGVVGRTGAGKSTLANAVCRIIEADSGSIIIDGINISELSLQYLRNHITVIAQDPILFEGTLLFNLDPEGKSDHERIKTVLSRA
jgi:ATP-binding cassette, subfamily C (CFTR/MRP), member 1